MTFPAGLTQNKLQALVERCFGVFDQLTGLPHEIGELPALVLSVFEFDESTLIEITSLRAISKVPMRYRQYDVLL